MQPDVLEKIETNKPAQIYMDMRDLRVEKLTTFDTPEEQLSAIDEKSGLMPGFISETMGGLSDYHTNYKRISSERLKNKGKYLTNGNVVFDDKHNSISVLYGEQKTTYTKDRLTGLQTEPDTNFSAYGYMVFNYDNRYENVSSYSFKFDKVSKDRFSFITKGKNYVVSTAGKTLLITAGKDQNEYKLKEKVDLTRVIYIHSDFIIVKSENGLVKIDLP